jgi:glutaredoxin
MIDRRLVLTIATALFLSSSITAYAQFGDLWRGIADITKSAGNAAAAVKSITEATTGRIPEGSQGSQGSQGSPDTEGKVVLYTTPWCGYCKQAMAHVRSKNIAHIEKVIENNPANNAEFKQLGGKGVPLIVMGSRTMSGFSATGFDKLYAEFSKDRPAPSPAPSAASASTSASTPNTPQNNAGSFQPGDVLIAKIPGVRVSSQPSKDSAQVMTLGPSDQMVFMGETQNGLLKVTTARGEGWVDQRLIKKP